jgi:RimJ/RimL family protein N-acetyltransferase
MKVAFSSPRFAIAPLTADDLDEALAVYDSQPEYQAIVEGSAGQPGYYDLGMLQRDWSIAQITPERTFAGMRLHESRALVGLLDWLDPNPNDGLPWIGLILVARPHERLGYAREAVEELIAHAGWPLVREAVIADNGAGLALARSLGFEQYGETERALAGGLRRLLLLERHQ